MIVHLDIGNTRIKWMLLSGARRVGFGALLHRDMERLPSDISRQVKNFNAGKAADSLKMICVANVAGAAIIDDLSRIFANAWSIMPNMVEVKKSFAGLTVSYNHITRLGVDRWLAMIAARQEALAHNIAADVVVINAGSAITVDYISSSGKHKGGVIVPGKMAMLQTMASKTHALQCDDVDLPAVWRPGNDTVDCIRNGLAGMLRGFVSEVIGYQCKSASEEALCPVFLSGGDADELHACLGDVFEKVLLHKRPHLVLEGMQVWAKLNFAEGA